jgi:hypothetical protein
MCRTLSCICCVMAHVLSFNEHLVVKSVMAPHFSSMWPGALSCLRYGSDTLLWLLRYGSDISSRRPPLGLLMHALWLLTTKWLWLRSDRYGSGPKTPSLNPKRPPGTAHGHGRRAITGCYGSVKVAMVIVTPAVYPRLFESLHVDIQSTGQKSHCVNTRLRPSQCFVLIRQSDSPGPCQF